MAPLPPAPAGSASRPPGGASSASGVPGLSPPARGVVARKCAEHLSDVGDYLALLAWFRVVMRLVGGPARTTIDTLMTRQFYGTRLVWVWTYTALVSSVSVAVVRWATAMRVRVETMESSPADDLGPLAAAVAGRSRAAAPYFAATVTVRRRFRASLCRRLASAFTYLTMWGWAVALLGTLPARTLAQDCLGVFVLSVAFALVVWSGARGRGPLQSLLKVTTERDGGLAAEDVAAVLAANEISAAARDGVRTCCEWILAVAWVGALRRAVFSAFEQGNPRADIESAATSAGAQCAGWVTAFLTIAFRAAFVVARAAYVKGTAKDRPPSSSASFAKTRRDEENARGDDDDDSGGTITAALLDADADDEEEGNYDRVGDANNEGAAIAAATRRGVGLRRADSSLLVPAPLSALSDVAKDASAMLAGAFAFTTGVGLNAAAQTSWKALAARWGVGAGVPGVTYAAALSAVAVYSAVYLEGARDDERRDDERRVDDDDDETMRTRRDEEEDAAAEESSRRNDHLERDGSSSSDGGVASRRPRLIAPLAAPFRKVGAKGFAAELAADEARVGAFVAGFVWNASVVAALGSVATDWPWSVAVAVTFVSASYSVWAEWAGFVARRR